MRYASIFLLLCFSLSGCSVKVPVGFEDANSEAEARSFASQSSVFILKREYKNDYIFSDPLTIDLIKDENGDGVAWVSEGFRFSAVFRLYGAQRDSSGSLEMTLCNYGDYQTVNIGYGAKCNFLYFYRSHSSGKYLAVNYSSTRKWIETSRTSNSITFSPADQPEVAGTIMVVDGNSIYFLCEEGKPQGKGWRACFAQSSHLFGSGPKSLAASGRMYRWDWDRYYALSKQMREKGVAARRQSEQARESNRSEFWAGLARHAGAFSEGWQEASAHADEMSERAFAWQQTMPEGSASTTSGTPSAPSYSESGGYEASPGVSATGNASSAGTSRRTLRFRLHTGMELGSKSTINPRCFSNVITVANVAMERDDQLTVEVRSIIESRFDEFLEKCAAMADGVLRGKPALGSPGYEVGSRADNFPVDQRPENALVNML